MTKDKTCSCCGGYAGKFQQWHNRDTGYGICVKCSDWMAERWPSENQANLYGQAGVHRAYSTYDYPSRTVNVTTADGIS